MAAGSDIRAGRSFVELYVNKSAFVKALKDAETLFKKWGEGFQAIGRTMMATAASILTPAVLASRLWQSAGHQLYIASKQTGASVEFLSSLKEAAEDVGVELGDVGTSIGKMQRKITEAAQKPGSDPMKAWLATLAGMRPEQQLAAIADRLSQISDPAERTAFAMEVFGKSGARMLPILERGAEGFREMAAEARELGTQLTGPQAKAAHEQWAAWDRLGDALTGVRNVVAGSLAPMITGLYRGLADSMIAIRQWIESHQTLIRNVAIGAGLLLAGGAAFWTFGLVVGRVGALFGVASKAIVALTTAVRTMFPLLLGGAAIGGAILMVGKLIGRIGNLRATMEGFFGRCVAGFREIADDAMAAFGQIADSLSAGDIQGAVSVVAAFAKMEWARLTTWLAEKWIGFRRVCDETSTGFLLAWNDVCAKMRSVWAQAIAAMHKGWQAWISSAPVEFTAQYLAPIMAKVYGVDPEDVIKNVREEFDRRQATLSDEFAKIDQETAGKRAEIEEGRRKREAELGQQLAAATAERASDEEEAASGLAAAQAEFQDALAKARARAAQFRGAFKPGAEPGRPGEEEGAEPDFLGRLPGRDEARGTFSGRAAAYMALGGGTGQERVVEKLVAANRLHEQAILLLGEIQAGQRDLAMSLNTGQ